MPTYQYACTECGEQIERVQSFSDPALTECPACSGKLRKVFNSVGIVFKGSGFYRNDSRSGPVGSEKAEKAEKPASTSSTSSAGKSDSSASSSTGSTSASSSTSSTSSASSSSTPSTSAASSSS